MGGTARVPRDSQCYRSRSPSSVKQNVLQWHVCCSVAQLHGWGAPRAASRGGRRFWADRTLCDCPPFSSVTPATHQQHTTATAGTCAKTHKQERIESTSSRCVCALCAASCNNTAMTQRQRHNHNSLVQYEFARFITMHHHAYSIKPIFGFSMEVEPADARPASSASGPADTAPTRHVGAEASARPPPYLWGRQFKLVIDHAALRWLHTMKDQVSGGPEAIETLLASGDSAGHPVPKDPSALTPLPHYLPIPFPYSGHI
eukprot:scaffold3334_cov139-Isochrysis_galbana.AAC.5